MTQTILKITAIVALVCAIWYVIIDQLERPIVGVNTFGQYVYLDTKEGREMCPDSVPSNAVIERAGGEC